MKTIIKRLRRSLISSFIRSLASTSSVSPIGRTLIIAPHPDDETFGCGGMIATRTAGDAPVDLIFMTYGEASHNACCHIRSEDVGAARRSQALAATGILGVTDEHIHWLGLRDGAIPAKDGSEFNRAVDQLAQIIQQAVPDEIYCPHPLDCWPDHEAAARILLKAVQVSGLPPSRGRFGGAGRSPVCFYLVWGWYGMQLRRLPRLGLGNVRRVDISSVRETKQAAINAYVGQHPPNCPNPYVGALPTGFMAPFQTSYEIFFEAGEELVTQIRT